MVFNLKNKKAQVDINDQRGLESYLQLLITQLSGANSLPTAEALARITDMNSLSQYGVSSFTELGDMIQQQMSIIEDQQNMQNNMVAPPQEPGASVLITPTAKGKNKMNKPFNLKKAQYTNPQAPSVAMPGFRDTLNDSPELQENTFNTQQDVGESRKFKNAADVEKWLETEIDLGKALQFVTENDISSNADLVKEMIEQFYDLQGDTMTNPRELEIVAGQIFDYLPESVKEGSEVQVLQKQFQTINDIINKVAQNRVNKNKKKAFNLTKTAQHKTMDNAILWGPGQTRIDPFLHQPVSDWHIVERNKGFGLVVDDIWNIDYETIWRENIMDKYSRPYKNKDGEWVGGYIQKRFEVDKNIPETSNMQLKPGQIRRPILPEYGNTESRLQAARAAGDIAGANDTSKPFNWKEASKKKS